MSTIIVIPARYASKRFPGKPLVEILGMAMIERVWRIAQSVKNVDAVYVATDDNRIAKAVTAFGGKALMTPDSCRNGTERCHAAALMLDEEPEIIINLQGDAVLTPPWIIQSLVDEMQANEDTPIGTACVHLTKDRHEALLASKANGEVGGTTVTFDVNGDAMYFSKRVIPLLRSDYEKPPIYRHIGIYAYRMAALSQYLELPMGVFEKAEEIEAIRALEHGIKMRVVQVDYKERTHWSVDALEDVALCEEIIAKEGELFEKEGIV